MNWRLVFAALASGLMLGALVDANLIQAQSPAETTSPRVTFNRDIAPIVFQNCALCHRPGESGPFPLLTYEDAKKHARQIEIVTRTRFMPPGSGSLIRSRSNLQGAYASLKRRLRP